MLRQQILAEKQRSTLVFLHMTWKVELPAVMHDLEL